MIRIKSKVDGITVPKFLAIPGTSPEADAALQASRANPLWRAWASEPKAQAVALLSQAIERDPRYGQALAALAMCHSQNFSSGWGDGALQCLQPVRKEVSGVGMAACGAKRPFA